MCSFEKSVLLEQLYSSKQQTEFVSVAHAAVLHFSYRWTNFFSARRLDVFILAMGGLFLSAVRADVLIFSYAELCNCRMCRCYFLHL